jgi:hypothetical protein
MRFVLTYRGLLPPNGDRIEKHAIRKQLHPQLKKQWEVEQTLLELTRITEATYKQEQEEQKVMKDLGMHAMVFPKAVEVKKGPFTCLPLVTKKLHLVCSLDIIMLRPESPGQILRSGGDIDNRMKTLFDGLRIPEYDNELVGLSPEPDETPFYCLLEDDALVTSLQVRTERLLRPVPNLEGHPEIQAELLIAINVRPTMVYVGNVGFLSDWLS